MANISIDRRYWVEDAVARAWPPGQEVFTGENNPKANYALDLNIDGKVMTFIPSSVINSGVYNPFNDIRVSGKSYYMPWFLDPKNQEKLAEVGSRVDLSKSDVGSYLKDKMGASTDGVLVPKDSIPFDSQIVNAPGKVQGIGNINGQPVYINEDVNNQGRTYFTDSSGQTKESLPNQGDDGLFGGFFSNPLVNAVANFAASYYGGPLGAAALQLAQGKSAEDALKAGALTYAAQQAFSSADPNAVGGVTGPDNIDVGGGFNPAAASSGFNAAVPDIGDLPTPGPGVQVASTAPDAGLNALGTTSGAAAGTTLSDVAAGNADKAALYGDAGYGAGMTGVETGAYDAGLAAGTAAAGAAAAGGSAAGSTLADILPYTTGATVAGSLISADAAKSAADVQAEAAKAAIEQQQKNFETINAQQAPYRAAGYNTLNEIAKLSSGQTPMYDYMGNIVKDAAGNPVMQTGSGYLTKQFTPEDFAAGIDPGYAFRLQQGQMANQRAANIGGGALSGNTLKGLQDYTQGLASTEYGNAFDRYQKQRQNIYNTLASIAGIGQTGQTATNTAATNATNAATQLGVGSAAATAAGGVGAANAYSNAINNAVNNYTLSAILNQRGNVVTPVP